MKAAIVLGDFTTGFKLIGPFDSRQDAAGYAMIDFNHVWYEIINLEEPQEYADE